MDQKMEEVLSLVAELAQEYAGYENSSVTYERAHTLMEAVLYHIDEYKKHSEAGIVPGDISVKEQYAAGRRFVLEEVAAIRDIMNEMSGGFEDFGVRCL